MVPTQMAEKRRFFGVSRNPVVWAFFIVALAGLIGWLTIGGTIFLVPIVIGIIAGTTVKARDG